MFWTLLRNKKDVALFVREKRETDINSGETYNTFNVINIFQFSSAITESNAFKIIREKLYCFFHSRMFRCTMRSIRKCQNRKALMTPP